MAEILEIEKLEKHFGAIRAADGFSLQVKEKEFHALIGPNGAGKTTIISLLSGNLKSDGGVVRFHEKDITHLPTPQRVQRGMARSYQITSIFEDFTVEDNVAVSIQAQQGHSFHFWKKARKESLLRETAKQYLDQVGLLHRASTQASFLAHGEKRELEIAMTLATNPSLLLLDEPLAGMGPEESLRMVQLLQKLKGEMTILLVEHDMGAVFSLADRITVLVYGKEIATGTPEEIRDHPGVKEAYLGGED